MKDEDVKMTIREIREKAGVTNKTIWCDRVKSWIYDVFWCMVLWCVYNGIQHMGWEVFFISLIVFIFITIIKWVVRQFYYGYKLKKKYPNKF